MAEPKTVSNLPLDVSVRWGQDQEFSIETQPITRDAMVASQMVRSEGGAPVNLSAFDAFLGLTKVHPSWATFQVPSTSPYQQRRIFRIQLAPCLGSDEHQESIMERIQQAQGEEHDREAWEIEKKRILHFYTTVQPLDKDLRDMYNGCKQYSKG